MSSAASPQPVESFKLDPTIFNQDFYQSILKLWLPSYPDPLKEGNFANAQRWFGSSLDGECTSLAAAALSSISPIHLRLPPVDPTAAGNNLSLQQQRELAAPLLPEFADAALKPSLRDRVDAALALVLLLDQLARNTLRADEQQGLVYAHYDRLARAVAEVTTSAPLNYDTSADSYVSGFPFWRFWFYMPLMHAENLEGHKKFGRRVGEMYERAKTEGSKEDAEFCETSLGLLEKHSKPIERFGRYPWRNRFLGREFTAEEREYIDNGGDTFGVKPYAP